METNEVQPVKNTKNEHRAVLHLPRLGWQLLRLALFYIQLLAETLLYKFQVFAPSIFPLNQYIR